MTTATLLAAASQLNQRDKPSTAASRPVVGESTGVLRSRQCVVYALPRGGVPVAVEVARVLSAPLDLILVRKIGVPFQPELALGAVADGDVPESVMNEDIVALPNADDDMIADSIRREMREIARRRDLYLTGQEPIRATGRVAFVVDGGLATGATARAALRAIRRQAPQPLLLAIPLLGYSAIKARGETVRVAVSCRSVGWREWKKSSLGTYSTRADGQPRISLECGNYGKARTGRRANPTPRTWFAPLRRLAPTPRSGMVFPMFAWLSLIWSYPGLCH